MRSRSIFDCQLSNPCMLNGSRSSTIAFDPNLRSLSVDGQDTKDFGVFAGQIVTN